MTKAVGRQIIEVRDKWHTKNHPFFRMMLDGSLDLYPLGVYMASHYKFVEMALPSFGFLLWKGPQDVKHAVIENLAEEKGLVAIPRPGHEPHDHTQMIFDFCAAASFSSIALASANGGVASLGPVRSALGADLAPLRPRLLASAWLAFFSVGSVSTR